MTDAFDRLDGIVDSKKLTYWMPYSFILETMVNVYSLLFFLLVAAPTAVAHHKTCEEALATCQKYHPDQGDQCMCVDCGDDSGEKCWTVKERRLGLGGLLPIADSSQAATPGEAKTMAL